MTPEAQAFIVFCLGMVVLMGMGVPMAFALVLTGAGMAWTLDFWDTQLLAQNLVAGVDSFPLLAVPFFILAGELMNSGGLSRRIVNFALALVGHIRGGLGIVAIFATVVMSAISGSAAADTAALTGCGSGAAAATVEKAARKVLGLDALKTGAVSSSRSCARTLRFRRSSVIAAIGKTSSSSALSRSLGSRKEANSNTATGVACTIIGQAHAKLGAAAPRPEPIRR